MVRAVKPHPCAHAVDGLIRRPFSTALRCVAPYNQRAEASFWGRDRHLGPELAGERNNPSGGCSVIADLGAVLLKGCRAFSNGGPSQQQLERTQRPGRTYPALYGAERYHRSCLRPLKSEGRPVRETPLLGWGARVVRDLSARASQPYLPKAGLNRDDQLGEKQLSSQESDGGRGAAHR
jgi:hypothetical protein